MTEEIHSFSDFAETHIALAGKKKHMDEVLNRKILICAHKIAASKKNAGGTCLHLQFELDGELCVLFTGSAVLIDQCEKYKDKFPFRATILKIDKYFTLS